MKKQTKLIIITSVFVVALAAVLLVFQYILPETEAVNADPYKDVSLAITSVSADDIELIKCRNFPNAPDFDVAVDYDKEAGEAIYTVVDNPNNYYYSDTYLSLMASTVAVLDATSVAADADADPADYGITDDSIQYTMKTRDGKEYTLYLGSTTPLGTGYYLKKSDSNYIYIIGTYNGSTLERDLYEMRTVVIYPTIDTYMDIKRLKIEYSDGSVVESVQLTDEEIAKGATYSLFKFTSPISVYINDDIAGSSYYEPATSLAVSEILEDSTDDLSQYGLDDPTVITFENNDDMEVTLWLGDYISEGETRYAKLSNDDCIFVVKGSFDFLNIDIYDLVDSTIWIHSTFDMKEINIITPDEKYEMFVDDFYADADQTDTSSSFYAEMNGEEIDEDNYRLFYQELVSFKTIGVTAELDIDIDKILTGDPEYRFDFVYRDGSEHYLYLYKVNDIQYIANSDGNALFYTSISQMNKIIRCLEIIKAGETIPEV